MSFLSLSRSFLRPSRLRKLIDLSDVAELISLLERFSYERKAESPRPGWVALSLREGGAPFEPIFACYDELLTAKVRSPPLIPFFVLSLLTILVSSR